MAINLLPNHKVERGPNMNAINQKRANKACDVEQLSPFFEKS